MLAAPNVRQRTVGSSGCRQYCRMNELSRSLTGHPRSGHSQMPQASRNALRAFGAVSLGAVALGVLAIGALAIGRLAIGRARIKRLEIDELIVRRLRVTEEIGIPPKPGPES
jgi:hypothetical protein